MLVTVGDVVDDIVVRLDGSIHVASDTQATIARRRGGSAANVAVVAAGLTGAARFLGQVGDDPAGHALLAELAGRDVDVSFVRRGGRSGAIVVLVDAAGERSFLTDPGASRALADPSPDWLDGADVLHIPLYSLAGGAIAETSATLAEWAYQRSIPVSIDLSSVAVIEQIGAPGVRARLEPLAPTVVLANADEAAALGIDGAVAGAITVVKRGPRPATVFLPGAGAVDVPARPHRAVDSTGAGDAFAAGFLSFDGWPTDPVGACAAGHASAERLLRSR